MSGFPAPEALALLDALFPFFFGEFFNTDRVDIHSIWIGFWTLVVSRVSLNWVRVVGFLRSDGIRSVPLGFEVDSPSVPFINRSRYSICTIYSLHERGGDSSREEVMRVSSWVISLRVTCF